MIQIIDDIYLDADENCVMLKFWNGKTTTKNEKEYPVLQGIKYYANYSNLIKGLTKILFRRDIQASESISQLMSLQAVLSQRSEEIGNCIKSFMK